MVSPTVGLIPRSVEYRTIATTDQPSETAVRDLLSVATLLEEPRLARLYAFVLRSEGSTVTEAVEALDLAQSTAYEDIDRLDSLGLLDGSGDPPVRYEARPVRFVVETDSGTYTVTPTLVAAVGRRGSDDDLATFLDRQGVGKLAAALEYAVPYADGAMAERVAARELGLHPVEAITALQALKPLVEEMRSVDPYFDAVGDARDRNG
jgi:DNA-binding transcriptional ArsR family regulator